MLVNMIPRNNADKISSSELVPLLPRTDTRKALRIKFIETKGDVIARERTINLKISNNKNLSGRKQNINNEPDDIRKSKVIKTIIVDFESIFKSSPILFIS